MTTQLNDNGEEKKNLISLLPTGWNKSDYRTGLDYKFGGCIKTGKISNILVLDCDTVEAYKTLCTAYPKLYQHYTVKTRRGYHVYFIYDPKLKKCNIDSVDFQSDNKLIIAEGTTVRRYNDETYKYEHVGGNILQMPLKIKELCTMKDEEHNINSYVINNKNVYDVPDEEIISMLNELKENHEEYFLNYDMWLKLTTVMTTINKFDIWDKFNRQYSSYSYTSNKKIWDSIKLSINPNFFCKLLKRKFFKFHKTDDEIKELNVNNDAIQIDQQYVNISHTEFDKNDTIVIQSKTGTGKTTCVSRLMDFHLKMNPQYSLLNIVNLISLANQQVSTFKKSGVSMTSYQTCNNPSLLMCDNSVICINSLGMLAECDFKNKIVYIDEVRALMNSLTHNTTLKNCRLIFATLLKIVKTCHKLIITDAHIENNINILLDHREGEVIHYNNSFNKFQDISAIELNNENEFYSLLEERIINDELFSFACDSCKTITNWYNKLYALATPEIQAKMILYTAESNETFCEDWKDKFIFYSPKITCGVDINVVNNNHTVQFLYINGKSVDSISLYQMSTRTRHMAKMYFYSSAKCVESRYESIEDCKKQQLEYFSHNKLALPLDHMRQNKDKNETDFLNIYAYNEYMKDLLKTDTRHYFIEEIVNAGFIVSQYGEKEKLTKELQDEMDVLTQEQVIINVETLCVAIDEDILEDVSANTEILLKRSDYLKLNTRELIQSLFMIKQYMNTLIISKSY